MPQSRFPLLSVTPAAVSDARELISCAEIGATAPESLRRLAWLVLTSARGGTPVQRHRGAGFPDGAA